MSITEQILWNDYGQLQNKWGGKYNAADYDGGAEVSFSKPY